MSKGTPKQSRGEVLIVEDDAEIRDFASELLELQGFHVTRAADGQQALEQLRAGDGTTCLILLDLMMPTMSGEEFRKAQLDDPAIASIPVVLMSGGGDMIAKARELGITEFMTKPMSLTCLVSVVERYCARGREERTS